MILSFCLSTSEPLFYLLIIFLLYPELWSSLKSLFQCELFQSVNNHPSDIGEPTDATQSIEIAFSLTALMRGSITAGKWKFANGSSMAILHPLTASCGRGNEACVCLCNVYAYFCCESTKSVWHLAQGLWEPAKTSGHIVFIHRSLCDYLGFEELWLTKGRERGLVETAALAKSRQERNWFGKLLCWNWTGPCQ